MGYQRAPLSLRTRPRRTLVAAALAGAIRKCRLWENRCYGDDAVRGEEKGDSRENSQPCHNQSPRLAPHAYMSGLEAMDRDGSHNNAIGA